MTPSKPDHSAPHGLPHSLPHRKHQSFNRRIRNFLFYLVLILLTFVSLLLFALDTPLGFKTLIHIAQPLLSKENIIIKGPIKGVLSDFELSDVQINSLNFQNINIKINLKNILEDEINLEKFQGTFFTESIRAPINLSGKISIKAPHSFSFAGKIQIQNSSFKTQLKNNFQIAGDLNHYQFSLQGNGLILNHSGHLIIQGFGSSSELHTEELAFYLSPLHSLNSPQSLLNGSLTFSSFSPWTAKFSLEGKNISLDSDSNNMDKSLSFKLNLLANEASEELFLSLNSEFFNTQVHAKRLSQSGLTEIDPLEIQGPMGMGSLPKTQVTIQSNLLKLPPVCLSLFANSNLSNSVLSNSVCTSFFLENNILNANLKINIQDLHLLQDFFPEANNLQGNLKGEMQASGPLSNLKYTGNLDLTHGNLGLSQWGIVLENISLALQSQGDSSIHIKANAQSGLGTLQAQGTLAYDPINPQDFLKINLNLRGSQLTVINLPVAQVMVSPDLTYTQDSKILALSGNVRVDSAHINADDYQSFSNQESQDIVFVNNKNKIIQTKKTLPFSIHLNLMAGPDVQFQGFGINTGIAGQIMISSNPNQVRLADGKLNLIHGQYQAYGKHFTIQSGTLIFNHSPVTNPSLDVSAVYSMTAIVLGTSSVSPITVGVKVTGTIQKIQLRLFSDPPMSQENILSYIATGQPLSQAGPGSQSALSQAALSFASGSGDQTVLNKIQDTLKLNQLSVGSLNNLPTNNIAQARNADSPNQDNTAVFIGKSLSSRFYVSYGVGLFNNEQIFMTHLTLSPHFYLQTDTSSLDAGADLFYTFEH